MAKDERMVGYIRTSLYSKTVGMFDPKRIVEMHAKRRLFKRTKREEAASGCVVYEGVHEDVYTIRYERSKKGEFPDKGIARMLRERNLTDFILNRVVIAFTSPKVIRELNVVLKDRYEAKHTPDAKRIFLKDETLYATYENNPREHFLYCDELNAKARVTMNAAIGVLDLTDLKTERAVKYGEREAWPIGEDTDLVRAALSALRFDGWPESERMVSASGMRVVPNPAAIRVYRRGRADAWDLAREVELNGR